MPGWTWLYALAALTAIGSATSATAEPLTLTHQGIERSAWLHQPPATGDGPRPLIVALHGLSQSAENLRGGQGCCSLQFDAVADREGLLVLYPQAVDLRWSYGRPIVSAMPSVGDVPVDDLGFIRALIDDLVTRKLADPARIYVTGVSRGGLMAYTLACALADRIAAVVPIISGMSDLQREDCRPTRPIPILVIAGTDDPIQWYDGALAALGRLLSVPETMELWRVLHGCTRQDARLLTHRERSDPTRLVRVDWLDCKSGAPVSLYRVQGGGHQVPSFTASSDETPGRFGRRNRDIETVEEIWTFVKMLSR
jgi:polyhydroxybutyrate depolymerase